MIIVLPLIMIFILIYLIADKNFNNNTKNNNDYIQKLIKEYEHILDQTNKEIVNNKKEISILKQKIKRQKKDN